MSSQRLPLLCLAALLTAGLLLSGSAQAADASTTAPVEGSGSKGEADDGVSEGLPSDAVPSDGGPPDGGIGDGGADELLGGSDVGDGVDDDDDPELAGDPAADQGSNAAADEADDEAEDEAEDEAANEAEEAAGPGDAAAGEQDTEMEDGQMEDNEDEAMMKAPTGKRSVEEKLQGVGNQIKATFSEWKKKIKGQYKKQMDKFKETMKKWGDSVKAKFSGLSASVRSKIYSGNVSGLSRDDIKTLNKQQLTLITPMNRLAVMSDEQKKNVYDRFRTQNDVSGMRRTFENMDNFTDGVEILNTAKQIMDKLSNNEEAKRTVVMAALRKIGSPMNWTSENITEMKRLGILNLVPPSKLMMIRNKTNLNKITIPDISDMAAAKKTEWANLIIHIKNTSKELSTWTSGDIRGVHNILGRVPVEVINKLPDAAFYSSFVQSSQSQVARIQQGPAAEDYGPQQAVAILNKLKTRFKQQTPSASPSNVVGFVSRLGALGRDYLTTDELTDLVAESQRGNSADMATMLKTTLGNADAPQISRCEVFKIIYKGQNLTEKISSDVNTIVNDGMLSCVPPVAVSDWVDSGLIGHAALTKPVAKMSEGMKRRMARKAAEMTDYQTNGMLDVAKLPAGYVSEAPPAAFAAATWPSLRNLQNDIKAGNIKLDPAQTAVFAQKGLSQGSSSAQIFTSLRLGPMFIEMVPAKDLKTLSSSAKKTAAMGSAQDSPLRMVSADDPSPVIPAAITPDNIDTLRQPALPQLSANMIVDKISTDQIQAVLEALAMDDSETDPRGDDGLNRKMCSALKARLAAQTQQQSAASDNDTSILAVLGPSEIASLPPCITARLWAGTVKSAATNDQKMALLSSLSRIKPAQLEGADKQNCENLVTDALKVMRSSGDLTAGDMSMVDGAAPCLTSAHIRRLDKQAFEAVKDRFQMACMSRAQADAIAERMTTHYGSPADWPVLPCGLLPLLDPAQLREIPEDRLALDCGGEQDMMDMMYKKGKQYVDAMKMNCKRQIGDSDFNNLMERKMSSMRRQARGVIRAEEMVEDALQEEPDDTTPSARRRRAADSDLTCDMVTSSAQGSVPWSTSEISQLSKEDLKMCQKELGRMKDEVDKLKHVWSRVKDAYDDKLGDIPMSDVGWVGAVIPTEDLKAVNMTFDDAVTAMGVPTLPMEEDQLSAVAARVKSQWDGASGSPSTWTEQDLVLMGQIICGLNASDVAAIPADNLKQVMQTLDKVYWCPPSVLEKLALKAVEINGNLEEWGRAEVADIGAMIGGLEATQLKSIKNESMGGMTAAGMMSIPPNKIGMLTAEQVGELQLAAALAVSDEQKSKLSSEAQTALQSSIKGLTEVPRSDAAMLESHTIISIGLLVITATLFR